MQSNEIVKRISIGRVARSRFRRCAAAPPPGLGLPPQQPSDDGAESLRGERSVHRTDENDLLIAHEELSARLLERNPVPRVPTISAEEQLELLFHGVALLDGYRVILSVQQRDLEIHAPSIGLPPEQRSDEGERQLARGTVPLSRAAATKMPGGRSIGHH